MTSKDMYCTLPFEGYIVKPDGDCAPCYGISDDIKLEHYESVDDYFASPLVKYMQEEMINERIPMDTCKECVRKQSEGAESHRERWMKRRNGLVKSQNLQFDPNKLRYLDISFSNTCNMTCVMCSNQFSTAWNKITKKMPQEILDIINRPREFTHSISYDEIDRILEKSHDLTTVALKGGEPLYDKKYLYFLKNLVAINPTVRIKLVSNISVMNPEIIDILSGFSDLSIHASIDGFGETYEYIRGYPFDAIEQNFYELARQEFKIEVLVCISAYNFRILQQTHDRFLGLGARNIVPIIAYNPHLHYRHLGKEVVEPITDSLDLVQPLRPEKFNYPTPEEAEQFQKYTAYMNKIRGFNWEDIPQ